MIAIVAASQTATTRSTGFSQDIAPFRVVCRDPAAVNGVFPAFSFASAIDDRVRLVLGGHVNETQSVQ